MIPPSSWKNASAIWPPRCGHARDRLGYEQFILGGWSGGGSMSLFYQDQAENPTITHTPAGDAYDLTAIEMPKVDGIMLLAAHISRAMTLTEWIDPSILDETKPFERDPELNIYDPANPNKAPYDEAYVARFRTAQIARNRRITAWVKDELAAKSVRAIPPMPSALSSSTARWPTSAGPIPRRIRPIGGLMNAIWACPRWRMTGRWALARFSTLRSWLSQWSYDDTNATGLGNAARISCPVLVINNTADLACTPSHANRLFEGGGHADKEYADVAGLTIIMSSAGVAAEGGRNLQRLDFAQIRVRGSSSTQSALVMPSTRARRPVSALIFSISFCAMDAT
jgi:pimeloyl-ACP methyl ester carboxylesterase